MQMPVGKHSGKAMELIVLKEPGYIHWMMEEQRSSALGRALTEARRLISIFDKKPLLEKCRGSDCTEAATLGTVYTYNTSYLTYWCDDCDPYQLGAVHGKLTALKTYGEALHHAAYVCDGHRSAFKELVRLLARAKGLPDRVGEKQAIAFFS